MNVRQQFTRYEAARFAREAALAWLAVAYPLAFGTDLRPLAIGVGRLVWPQAKAAGIKRPAPHDALKFRTSSFRYLEALAADAAVRCDLNGNAVEPVSAEHRNRALEMKAEFERIHRERARARSARP
jgi:sRNA-binding protein